MEVRTPSERIVQTGPVPRPLAPPPTIVNGRRSSRPTSNGIDAPLRFDVDAREATGEAPSISPRARTGHPALDLRQPVEWLRLDGDKLATDAFAPLDLGAGPGSEMRVLDVPSRPAAPTGSRSATGSTPPWRRGGADPWVDGGVRFDLWMSDLQPGRTWRCGPGPAIHDRFAFNLDVELLKTDRLHP